MRNINALIFRSSGLRLRGVAKDEAIINIPAAAMMLDFRWMYLERSQFQSIHEESEGNPIENQQSIKRSNSVHIFLLLKAN